MVILARHDRPIDAGQQHGVGRGIDFHQGGVEKGRGQPVQGVLGLGDVAALHQAGNRVVGHLDRQVRLEDVAGFRIQANHAPVPGVA